MAVKNNDEDKKIWKRKKEINISYELHAIITIL